MRLRKKIFISYTLRGAKISVEFLKKLQISLSEFCDTYVDILHNDSISKQLRVENELKSSDFILLIRTKDISKSDWVNKELKLAHENNIPVIAIDFEEFIKEFQPITMYIKHLAESTNIKGSTITKHCNGLIGNRFEMPNVSYT